MPYGFLPDPLPEPNCDREARYVLFRRDFIEAPPASFAPKDFRIDTTIREDGKEESFYHLTTTGKDERKHDPHRCSRIEWGKPVIERVNRNGPDIVTWRVRQNGETRVKIALHDFAYLVVLSEDAAAVRLITAFYPHTKEQREKLRREFRRAAPPIE